MTIGINALLSLVTSSGFNQELEEAMGDKEPLDWGSRLEEVEL